MHPAIKPMNKSPEMVMGYSKPEDREEITCPVCHSNAWEKMDQVRKPLAGWSHLSICQTCGFITFNPQLKNMASYYATEIRPQSVNFVRTKANKLDKHNALLFKYLNNNNIRPNNILDYGCSDGYLMKAIDELESDPSQIHNGGAYHPTMIGVEANKGHANWAKYVENLNVTTEMGLTQFEVEQFDLVVLYHVLEHIQKPDQFLKELNSKMQDGGLLYLALPTLDRIDYPTVELLFKDEHINFWTDASLEDFLNKHGFEKKFFDNSMYGTCMILKKQTMPYEPRSFYNENKILLGRIAECFAHKREMDKIMNDGMALREKASVAGRAALLAYDNFPDVIIRTGSMMDQIDEEDWLEDWIAKKPHLKEIQLQLAMLCYKDGNTDKAEILFKKLIEEFARPLTAVSHLAFIEYNRGNIPKAIEYIKETLDMSPYDAGTFEVLCSIVAQM